MSGRLWRVCRRRGGIVPLVAISLVMVLSFVALAVDAGYIYVSRSQMQRAADASALAGASALLDGDYEATMRAVECAGQNAVGGYPVSGEEVTVIIGNWAWTTREFLPAPPPDEQTVSPNAVRVLGARSEVPLFFAPVMGIDTTDLIKDAVALVGSGICLGIWGLEGIGGEGNVFTDSYDSQDGAYGAGNVHPNGDICSCQNIYLQGDVDIHGDAMYGEGYSLMTEGSAYEVWGVAGEQRCGDFVPSFDMETASRENDNVTIGLTDRGHDPFRGSPWDLVLNGNDNLTLAGGTYYFTSVSMAGQATLTIAGPTTIYISGPAEFSGGGLTNVSQNPADLLIYSTGATMILSGSAGFYGAVIAPSTDIALVGTGDYYGTILGRTLDMDGTANLHVDESLVEALFGLDSVAPVLVQ
ncbi:MAG: pilus assembly protein TadG-related protein [Phycisphaerae bacterium]